jgi:hypothetical protein
VWDWAAFSDPPWRGIRQNRRSGVLKMRAFLSAPHEVQ